MAEERYKFTEEYHTGIAFIDEEHKHLFDLANEAYAIMTDEFTVDKYDNIVALLNELGEYTKTHFAHEEEYMKSIHFQYFWSELRAHKLFIAKMESYDLSKIDESQDQALLELLDFLANWLVAHIKGADRRIGEATRKLEAEGDETAKKAGEIKAAVDTRARPASAARAAAAPETAAPNAAAPEPRPAAQAAPAAQADAKRAKGTRSRTAKKPAAGSTQKA